MAQILSIHDSLGDSSKEKDIILDFQEAYDYAYRNTNTWIKAADDDLRFYLGDQWSALEKRMLMHQKRSALVFNKIKRIVKMIGGFERKTRMSLIAEPVEKADQQLSDDWTAILLHQMRVANMHMVMSEAFEASLKVGMNLVNLAVNFTDDLLSGSVELHRIPHTNFLIDPRFTKRDLSDAQFVLTRRMVGKESLKAILPNQSELIDELPAVEDNRYPSLNSKRHQLRDDVIAVDEYWKRKFKKVTMILDRQTGETLELGDDELSKSKLSFMLKAMPQLVKLEKSVKTVELNVIANNTVIYSGEDPYRQGDFPFIPVIAFYDPEFAAGTDDNEYALRIQGIVRGLKDAQIEVNKRRSKALDILDSQINSGWIAKENALVNNNDFFQSGQGKVMLLKEEALMSDVQKIQAPDIPPNMIAFSEILDKDLMEIAGASSELFGMPENDNLQISGLLAKVRQGAGLTILQDIFDNYRFAQRLLGIKLIKSIKNNYSMEKLSRILGREASPNLLDKGIEYFDIAVEEATETPNQKNLQFLQLMQARQAGIAIPDSVIIDAMPLQNKGELKAVLEQQAQVQAQAQQQTQASVDLMTQARAASDFALAQERTARVQENLSQKVENQADAALARTRAIKELEEMDINRFLKIMGFVKAIEQENADQTNNLVKQNASMIQRS